MGHPHTDTGATEMAKRKRLQPAQGTYLEGQATPTAPGVPGISGAADPAASSTAPQKPASKPASLSGAGLSSAAPIAQVASEAAATAALEELSGVLETARAKGLMIEELPLDVIDPSYLVRDRVGYDEAEMQGLMQSIMLRGQQTPIEVVKFDAPKNGKTHGLISGWRRLEALSRLYKEDSEPDRFATVKARAVQPSDAQGAYIAMVEENEIRVNLSHYERARIALKALEMGLYDDQRRAILGLFGNASRTKRSKIASFATLVKMLDAQLRFPTAISEKLGLALVQRLEADAGFAPYLRDQLRQTAATLPAQEVEVLTTALENYQRLTPALDPEFLHKDQDVTPSGAKENAAQALPKSIPKKNAADWQDLPGDLRLSYDDATGKIELSGRGVDTALHAALKDWLSTRG